MRNGPVKFVEVLMSTAFQLKSYEVVIICGLSREKHLAPFFNRTLLNFAGRIAAQIQICHV